MADKSKILQNAQHFMAKGQIEKAIAEWKKLISETPNDGNIYNTIGDLYLKIKKTPQALETYLKGADAFREAGFALKTIAVYKKLIKLAPERIDILVKLGDLNVERGMGNNAVQDYLSAAKKYSQTGQIRESLDVYRKIADADPSKTVHREKLAEMCLKGGLKQDAVNELVKLRNHLKENNKTAEADSVQDKINSIDPTGDLQGAAPTPPGAVPKPDAGEKDPLVQADASSGKGDFVKAKEILSSFLSENPENAPAREKLAAAHLKTGNKDEAFESVREAVRIHKTTKEYGPAGKLLKDFLTADPERIEAHILLGEVYEAAGNPSLAIPSFAHAIDEYLISGDTAGAKGLYSKIKILDPNHRDVRRLRHSCEGVEGAPAQAASAPAPGFSSEAGLESTMDAPGGFNPPQDAPLPAAPPPMEVQASGEEMQAATGGPSSAPLVDPADLEEYFTEAEVFIKYGLPEKAIGQMNKILALDPENPRAHENLKTYYLDQGQNDKAVAECIHLMNIYKALGESQKREENLAEALKIDPENPQLKEAGQLSPLLDSGRVDALLEEEPAPSQEELPALELEGGLETMADPMADAMADAMADPMADAMADPMADPMAGVPESSMADPMADSMGASDAPDTPVADGISSGGASFDEKLSEADFYLSQGIVDEARKLYEEILAQDPLCSPAREKLDSIIAQESAKISEDALDLEKTREEVELEQDLDQSFSSYMDDSPRPENAEPVSAGPLKSKDEMDLEEDLDQSFSSYMTDEPVAPAKPKPADPAPKAQPSAGEDLVDLSELLNTEEFGAELENLFADAEKEHQEEAQEEEVDYENHYNLGIAYKEMGLISEAITEFEKSLKGTDRFVDSSHMLAGCLQENGELGRAAELLEKALADEKCDDNQQRWLRYDLASLHEKENKLEQALEEFETIQNQDPTFKDISKRIKKLQGLLGKGESVEETSQDLSFDGDEDLELMMDKIFGEISSPDLDSSGKVGAADPGAGDGAKKKDRISYL